MIDLVNDCDSFVTELEGRCADLESANGELTKRLHDLLHYSGKYKELRKAFQKIEELELRIEKAKALVGNKSLDSRRELLAVLEGR